MLTCITVFYSGKWLPILQENLLWVNMRLVCWVLWPHKLQQCTVTALNTHSNWLQYLVCRIQGERKTAKPRIYCACDRLFAYTKWNPHQPVRHCTSAGKGLMLFMLRSPHSATSCFLLMKRTLTCRLWKTVLHTNTNALWRNHLSTTNRVRNCAHTYMRCNTWKHRSATWWQTFTQAWTQKNTGTWSK